MGDVRDADLRLCYEESVIEYYKLNDLGLDGIRKSDELFVERCFFTNLRNRYSFIKEVIVTDKIGTIENELTKYRYDVLLKIKK